MFFILLHFYFKYQYEEKQAQKWDQLLVFEYNLFLNHVNAI